MTLTELIFKLETLRDGIGDVVVTKEALETGFTEIHHVRVETVRDHGAKDWELEYGQYQYSSGEGSEQVVVL
jgi:hypothetical protein